MTPGWTLIVDCIGVASFVLAIPMAVLANMLTPKIQRWWATTSKARRDRRSARLIHQLAVFERFSSNDRDELLSKLLVRLCYMALYGVLLLMCTGLFFQDLVTSGSYHVALLNDIRWSAKADQSSGRDLRMKVASPSRYAERFQTFMLAFATFLYILWTLNLYLAMSYSRRLSPGVRMGLIGSMSREIESLTSRDKQGD